ncbi:MAG: hypothetical protein ACO4CG_08040 [Prochlorothrix sp.]|nr:hypothetical protein [Prochlorothrix sp.]
MASIRSSSHPSSNDPSRSNPAGSFDDSSRLGRFTLGAPTSGAATVSGLPGTSATPSIAETEPAVNTANGTKSESEAEKILCPHCRRTATNGIKCKGICVADNDY